MEILKKRQLNIASAARVDQCQQSLGREIFICNQHPDEVDVFRSRCFERQITSLEPQCGQWQQQIKNMHSHKYPQSADRKSVV